MIPEEGDLSLVTLRVKEVAAPSRQSGHCKFY